VPNSATFFDFRPHQLLPELRTSTMRMHMVKRDKFVCTKTTNLSNLSFDCGLFEHCQLLVYHLRNITPAYARTTNLPTCCIQSPKRTANFLYPIVNAHCQPCCFNLLRLHNFLLPLHSLRVMEHLDTWVLGELLLKEGISCHIVQPLKVLIGSDTQLCLTTKSGVRA